MGYQTEKIFGKREYVHIVSPDFLSLPKLEMELEDNVKVSSGEFVNATGEKITLTTEKKAFFLVTEDSHYNDMLSRPKPGGVAEGFFGMMVIHTKRYDEGDTAFSVGDGVTIIDGKIAHLDADHTVRVGQIVKRGTDWLAITLGA